MARLSQVFLPRDREFFDLFEEAGANIVRAAQLLERMLDEWPDHGELGRDVVVAPSRAVDEVDPLELAKPGQLAPRVAAMLALHRLHLPPGELVDVTHRDAADVGRELAAELH